MWLGLYGAWNWVRTMLWNSGEVVWAKEISFFMAGSADSSGDCIRLVSRSIYSATISAFVFFTDR